MGEVYKMIPVKSETKDALDRDLHKLKIERGNRKTTWDDLITDMRQRY